MTYQKDTRTGALLEIEGEYYEVSCTMEGMEVNIQVTGLDEDRFLERIREEDEKQSKQP
ncbi:MAG: hypothetical protein WC359_13475 [Dehalococcoidia bacterium]|jgi:hypothetical protein